MKLMRKIFSILAIVTLISCTPNEEEINCSCGTITNVQANPDKTQFKYDVLTDCNTVYSYESRVEILQVGMKKCN